MRNKKIINSISMDDIGLSQLEVDKLHKNNISDISQLKSYLKGNTTRIALSMLLNRTLSELDQLLSEINNRLPRENDQDINYNMINPTGLKVATSISEKYRFGKRFKSSHN